MILMDLIRLASERLRLEGDEEEVLLFTLTWNWSAFPLLEEESELDLDWDLNC